MHQVFSIARTRDENARTRTLVLDGALDAAPGQFVMVWLPGEGERPYSVADAAPLTLTVVAVGPFSRALHRLQPGDRVWVRGPLGQGFALWGRRHLLVGGGYGVAPLLFLARRARAAGHRVTACVGAGRVADVLLAAALAATGAEVRITTEDGSRGRRGLVTAAMDAAIAARRPSGVYACGPVPMLEAVAGRCRAHRLPHQLSWEARMRCGLGLCGECELASPAAPHPGWRVCADGPVARYPSVDG